MALFRNVNGERVQMTPEEEQETLAEWAAAESAAANRLIERKRQALIDDARNTAIEAMISTERAQIENMDEAALDAQLAAKGIEVV